MKDALQLIKEMVDNQYGDISGDYQEVKRKFMRGEEAKERMKKKIDIGYDLTNITGSRIRELIEGKSSISVGYFIFKFGTNISLYELINGLHQRVHIVSDSRFKDAPFLSQFKKPMISLTDEIIVEIIKYLQMIIKIGVFL